MAPDLSVELAPHHKTGLHLRNPVLVASGTFGYGTEYASLVDIQRLGAIVSTGVTLRPRRGNRQPRIAETPAGMLNSIGLQNIGLRRLLRDKAPIWAGWQVPVIVNIAAETLEEFDRLAAALEDVPGIAGLEVNLSCPNADQGGVEFGSNPAMAAAVTQRVRRATTLPVIVKLTPNVADIRDEAQAVEDAGADAVTVANTLYGLAIDVESRSTVMPRGVAGLSGPAIKPIALYHVYRAAQAVSIPIIGSGGIATTNDALEFIMAGASAVQVGTVTFVDPTASLAMLDGLEAYATENSLGSLHEIRGAAQP